jgi:hypothetical protein
MTTDDNPDRWGGRGAYVTGTVSLTAGDEVMIVVGQKGEDGTGSGGNNDQAGGGGGTFVFKKVNSVTTRLLVAGGGGGAGKDQDGQGGMAGNNGGNNGGDAANAGTNGGDDGNDSKGKGGKGCSSSTCSFTGESASGSSREGGFGGGGKGHDDGGGGGAGYNGGGGGDDNKGGGGGGSYKAGLSSSSWTAGTNDGHGFVVVSKNTYTVKNDGGACTNIITTIDECRTAAYAVLGVRYSKINTGNLATNGGDVQQYDHTDYIYGCYIHSGGSSGGAYQHETFLNTNAAADDPCSGDNYCLCRNQ